MNAANQIQLGAQLPNARQMLGFVPSWQGGESLYGWASRYHRLYGVQEKATGLLLFGRAHACRLRDTPTGLDRFCLTTGGRLGGFDSILRERTPVGLYWPFLSARVQECVIQATISVSGVSVPLALGLPAARMGVAHKLARCPQCDAAWRKNGDIPSWRVHNQIPGALLCTLHHRPLHRLKGERNYWEYPDTGEADELPGPKTDSELQALQLLAAQGRALFGIGHVEMTSLRHASLHRLRTMGLCTSDKRLSSRRVQAFFDASPVAGLLRRHPEVQRCPRGAWIPDLLRNRTATHPMKWMLLWNALAWDLDCGTALTLFKDALTGISQFRLDPQTTLWDCPSESLGRRAPEVVRLAFDRSQSVMDAAAELGITSSAARRWLEDYPELLAEWKERRFESRLQRARQSLSDAIDEAPFLDRAGLLRVRRADSEWLRLHAPRTLRAALERIPSPRNRQLALF